MRKFSISFTKSAAKELKSLEKKEIAKILSKIELLAENPRIKDSKKLQGNNQFWRLRSGNYRKVYSINDELFLVIIKIIRHRKDAYKSI